jgi:hypothetical protein
MEENASKYPILWREHNAHCGVTVARAMIPPVGREAETGITSSVRGESVLKRRDATKCFGGAPSNELCPNGR